MLLLRSRIIAEVKLHQIKKKIHKTLNFLQQIEKHQIHQIKKSTLNLIFFTTSWKQSYIQNIKCVKPN